MTGASRPRGQGLRCSGPSKGEAAPRPAASRLIGGRTGLEVQPERTGLVGAGVEQAVPVGTPWVRTCPSQGRGQALGTLDPDLPSQLIPKHENQPLTQCPLPSLSSQGKTGSRQGSANGTPCWRGAR